MSKTPPALNSKRLFVAVIFAPLVSISPWLLLFFPFLIIWQDILLSMFIILYVGVVLFGIPLCIDLHRKEHKSKLKFVLFGAVFGQFTPIATKILLSDYISGIEEASGVGMLFGAASGALCAYTYYRIIYGRS